MRKERRKLDGERRAKKGAKGQAVIGKHDATRAMQLLAAQQAMERSEAYSNENIARLEADNDVTISKRTHARDEDRRSGGDAANAKAALGRLAPPQRAGCALAVAAAVKMAEAGGVTHDVAFVELEALRAAQSVDGSEAQRIAVLADLKVQARWPTKAAELWAEVQDVLPEVAAQLTQGQDVGYKPTLKEMKAARNAWIQEGMGGDVKWQLSSAYARMAAEQESVADPCAELLKYDPRVV